MKYNGFKNWGSLSKRVLLMLDVGAMIKIFIPPSFVIDVSNKVTAP